MKRIIVCLMIGAASLAAAGVGDVTLRLQEASVSKALSFYSGFSGLELTIAPAATNHSETITLDIDPPLPKKDAAEKIATALREQTGVVITPVDNKHASVTRAAGNTNTNLTFFIVSSVKTDGSTFFDKFPFLKLGYVQMAPDLVITRLKEVNLAEKPAYPGLRVEQESGTTRKVMFHPAPRLYFTLFDEDAARVKALARTAPNQKLLVMFNGKPLSVHRMSDVADEAVFFVPHNSANTTELKKTTDDLRKLVSQ
jgi:hypothetical protein